MKNIISICFRERYLRNYLDPCHSLKLSLGLFAVSHPFKGWWNIDEATLDSLGVIQNWRGLFFYMSILDHLGQHIFVLFEFFIAIEGLDGGIIDIEFISHLFDGLAILNDFFDHLDFHLQRNFSVFFPFIPCFS